MSSARDNRGFLQAGAGEVADEKVSCPPARCAESHCTF